ncbi:hypothetical protein [Dryocola clanedunensis]
MTTYDIQQEWLTLDEVAEVMKQRNVSLLPGDLYRHALHGNLTLSVWFQSPVQLRPLGPQCNPGCQNDDQHKQCTVPLPLSVRRHPCLRHTAWSIWDLPLIGLERLFIQRMLAKALGYHKPPLTDCCHESGIVVCSLSGQHYQLCDRKPLREIALEVARRHDKLPDAFHRVLSRLYNSRFASRNARLNIPFWYLPDHFPQDAVLVLRKSQMDILLKRYQSEKHPRVTTPFAHLFWLACKKNPLLDDNLLAHPYKLTNIFESWAREEGLTVHVNGDTLKRTLERGAP